MKYSATATFFAAVTIVMLAQSTARTEHPLRTWKDNTGTFEVEASLATINDDDSSVDLKLQSGELVTVSIDRLSLKDQTHIAKVRLSQASKTQPGSTAAPNQDKTKLPKQGKTQLLNGIKWHETLVGAQFEATGASLSPVTTSRSCVSVCSVRSMASCEVRVTQ